MEKSVESNFEKPIGQAGGVSRKWWLRLSVQERGLAGATSMEVHNYVDSI